MHVEAGRVARTRVRRLHAVCRRALRRHAGSGIILCGVSGPGHRAGLSFVIPRAAWRGSPATLAQEAELDLSGLRFFLAAALPLPLGMGPQPIRTVPYLCAY